MSTPVFLLDLAVKSVALVAIGLMYLRHRRKWVEIERTLRRLGQVLERDANKIVPKISFNGLRTRPRPTDHDFSLN